MFNLIQYTLVFTSVLILVALGGMFSERSGVINIGLEGIMVFGAMGGAMAMVLLPDNFNAFLTVVITLLSAIAAGVVGSLLLAVACINFKADQTLVGTAINMLATAFALVFSSESFPRKAKSSPEEGFIAKTKAEPSDQKTQSKEKKDV